MSRSGNKGGKSAVRAEQRRHVAEREALERRWASRLWADATLSTAVTHAGAHTEPFHRWLAYRQCFSPDLVRRFVQTAGLAAKGVVMDPFSGAGTVVIECARQRRMAIGIEALPVLAWLTSARWVRDAPPLPVLGVEASFAQWHAGVDHPAHRAAVLMAVGQGISGTGQRKIMGAPPGVVIAECLEQIAVDVRTPLSSAGYAVVGDAREMPVADESVSGVLTSPPYLSRYDYPQVVAPMQRLFGGGRNVDQHRQQLRAAVGQRGAYWQAAVSGPIPPAAAEVADRLAEQGNPTDAAVVRNYFADLDAVMRELGRVLRPAAPAWIVIGGADIDREYVPADLMVAEQALNVGFHVEAVIVARRLRPQGRRLGGLDDVAPRETLIRLRRV